MGERLKVVLWCTNCADTRSNSDENNHFPNFIRAFWKTRLAVLEAGDTDALTTRFMGKFSYREAAHICLGLLAPPAPPGAIDRELHPGGRGPIWWLSPPGPGSGTAPTGAVPDPGPNFFVLFPLLNDHSMS